MTALTYTAPAGRPHRRHVAHLRQWLPRAVERVRRPPAAVHLALVGDARMADLHERFMNVAGTTDVLTFELDHDARGRCVEGEVVVCVPYASRAARRHGHADQDEVLLYALHGVLHLSGYDDLDPAAHARMHREEDRILKAIGAAARFDRSETRPL